MNAWVVIGSEAAPAAAAKPVFKNERRVKGDSFFSIVFVSPGVVSEPREGRSVTEILIVG